MPHKSNRKTAAPDLSAISFPSDRITLAQIRKEQPDWFTNDALGEARASYFNAINTVRAELTLAEKAWSEALGRPGPEMNSGRLEGIVMLNDDYVRYGLSTGLAMTRQLVRDFERAAAEKARQTLGKGR